MSLLPAIEVFAAIVLGIFILLAFCGQIGGGRGNRGKPDEPEEPEEPHSME